MPLVDTAAIVRRACDSRYAVLQINTNGAAEELTRAIVEAAEESRSPIILGAYETNLNYRGMEFGGMLMRWFAEHATVPVAIQLDHGSSIDICRDAIDAGFTSVMIDASAAPIDENIATTQAVVGLAQAAGVSVEAEVGQVQSAEAVSDAANLSDPDEVARMARETGIDMLAVGIGTAHGFYKGKPNIRFDLLEQLTAVASLPLVLHGGTGLEDDVVRRCVANGMAKVNVGTLVRTRCVEYTAEAIEAGQHQNHPWRVAEVVKHRIKDDIRHLIAVVGSAARADDHK
ncbi:MAG: class II fructose-bisphosphate aldolase [Lentisphaeria bacterium]|nr:class II fructose-bisphosphate aldolase [Lentisphaeria bacterium]MDP7742273.1 class II fructose-bisphosphate aldolase [Lentisphaeria bacterium]